MGVDKIVLRAFLNTLAAIGVLILFLIASLCAFYPSTMMNVTYDLGMETCSIHFAERAYKSSDDIYYIAYATEVAIGEGKDKKIERCGERFIADDGFGAYCKAYNEKLGEDVDGTYEQYVFGQVCTAKYRLNKRSEAVAKAFEWVGANFVKNNAVVAVLIAALQETDGETVQQIITNMDAMRERVAEKDLAYFERTYALADGFFERAQASQQE